MMPGHGGQALNGAKNIHLMLGVQLVFHPELLLVPPSKPTFRRPLSTSLALTTSTMEVSDSLGTVLLDSALPPASNKDRVAAKETISASALTCSGGNESVCAKGGASAM